MTNAHDNPTGTSLAKCPVAIIGMALPAYGIDGLSLLQRPGGEAHRRAPRRFDRGRGRTTVGSREACG
jgi:hypothetical protein